MEDHELEPGAVDSLIDVAGYAFPFDLLPTIEEVHQAEEFVFGSPNFYDLSEDERQLCVGRLAVVAPTAKRVLKREGEQQLAELSLWGDVTVRISAKLHEGTLLVNFDVLPDEDAD